MRQFVAVAEERHFGRAAIRLNMSQPPLSQAIARLEIDLGFALLRRTRKSVELTEAGDVFLIEARRTLLQAEVARKMAHAAAAEIPEVRISFIGPALYQVLPELLISFRAEIPSVHARLFEIPTPRQIEGILSGDYHVGFITHGIAHEGCQTRLIEASRSWRRFPRPPRSPSGTLSLLLSSPSTLSSCPHGSTQNSPRR